MTGTRPSDRAAGSEPNTYQNMETTTTDRAKGIAIARAMKPGGLGIRIPQRDKLRNPRWTLVSCVRGGGRPTGGKLFVENL